MPIPKRPPREIEVMPLGKKYKGVPIHEIPSSYLRWVATEWDENRPFVAKVMKACDDELQFRERYNCHVEDDDVPDWRRKRED